MKSRSRMHLVTILIACCVAALLALALPLPRSITFFVVGGALGYLFLFSANLIDKVDLQKHQIKELTIALATFEQTWRERR